MKRISEGKYELSAIELAALCGASIEQAHKVKECPDWNPEDEALPYIVSQAHELLYGTALFNLKA